MTFHSRLVENRANRRNAGITVTGMHLSICGCCPWMETWGCERQIVPPTPPPSPNFSAACWCSLSHHCDRLTHSLLDFALFSSHVIQFLLDLNFNVKALAVFPACMTMNKHVLDLELVSNADAKFLLLCPLLVFIILAVVKKKATIALSHS